MEKGDNFNTSNDKPSSSALKITYTDTPSALRAILSKMEFDELLNARLVCKIWNKESGFFIKQRITWINFEEDSQLEQYLKSEDRSLFPSIKLDLGKLSAEVLAKLDLEGVQKLCLKWIPDQQQKREYRARFGFAKPDGSEIWNVKGKIKNLLQSSNKISSLSLHFDFPVTFTKMEEADFVLNLGNLRSLTFLHEDCCIRSANDIGSILIHRCPSLNYLKLKFTTYCGDFLGNFIKLVNEREKNCHPNLILSIFPDFAIYLDGTSLEKVNQLANFGARFEMLKFGITSKQHVTQQQLNETFKAAETIIENSADILKELRICFKYQGYQSTDKLQLKIPFLPKLEKLELGVSIQENYRAKLEPVQLYQLPDEFPSVKQLVVSSNKDVVAVCGQVLPNLQRLTFENFFNCKVEHLSNMIPYPASLRAVHCTDEVTQDFLRFVFTNLTSIRELKIKLQGRTGYGAGPYFDTWDIFTGGAQPPPNVAPTLYSEQSDSDDEDGSDEVAGNPVNNEDNVGVASLENFTNLRELEIINATLRDIQAVTLMTQLKKMQRLDKLSFRVRVYKKGMNIQKYSECIDILKEYHRRVVTHVRNLVLP